MAEVIPYIRDGRSVGDRIQNYALVIRSPAVSQSNTMLTQLRPRGDGPRSHVASTFQAVQSNDVPLLRAPAGSSLRSHHRASHPTHIAPLQRRARNVSGRQHARSLIERSCTFLSCIRAHPRLTHCHLRPSRPQPAACACARTLAPAPAPAAA